MKVKQAAVALACVAAMTGAVAPAQAADRPPSLCVGGPSPCFTTVQAAVDAAGDGATIRINAGTFAGGVTITKSLTIVGSGASRTVIKGGGPVITIGADGDANGETVSITGITVAGGRNGSVPGTDFTLGGGILVYWGLDGPGATVTMSDSVVRDNSANPTTYDDCGFPCAFSLGGGIFNAGRMTLDHVDVSGNVSGPAVSRSWAGGIWNDNAGVLTVRDSSVSRNQALATGPYGRVSESGGVHNMGVLLMSSSTVAENVSAQTSALTVDDDHVPNAGGITDHNVATIRDSVIRDNRVIGINTSPTGFTNAFGGGIVGKGDLTLTGSRVTGNSVTVISKGIAVSEGGGIAIDIDSAGATIRDSVIDGNSVVSRGAVGNFADGGGLTTGGATTLGGTTVRNNTVRASGGHAAMPWGDDSLIRGGGIANFSGDPNPSLVLRDSVVSGNVLSASPGLPVSGGGVFTTAAYSATGSIVTRNVPDQCAGATC